METLKFPGYENDTLIYWQEFQFEIPRFWTSPPMLPRRAVVQAVLKRPFSEDIFKLCACFGSDFVKDALEQLKNENDISEKAYKISKFFLEIWDAA